MSGKQQNFAINCARLLLLLASSTLTGCASETITPRADSRIFVVDPRHLLNSRLQLLDELQAANRHIRPDLRHGRRQLFIMHISCPTCREVVAQMKAQPDPTSRLVVLDLAQDDREDPALLAGLPSLRLPQGLTVSSPVPLLLELRDGVVVGVKEDFP